MCQQIDEVYKSANNNNNKNKNKMKPNYSIKKILKTFFKKQQKQTSNNHHHHRHSNSLESLESLENMRNTEMEHFYEEIGDNSANEKLANMMANEEQDIYVPVRFARTDAGTFFWTTNLQPVATFIPANDESDLTYCYNNQQSHMQFQDRWAQA